VSAMMVRRISLENEFIHNDLQDISDQQRANFYYKAMEPSADEITIELPPTPFKPPELFDWELFNTESDKFPHILLIGASGDGKSVTATWMSTWLSGQSLVVNPHDKPDDFPGIPSFCGGRNYGDWEVDESVPFEGIRQGLHPDVSAASFFKSLIEEMDERYKRRREGDDDFPIVNIIIDEFPSIVASLKEVRIPFLKLIREARKVKLRLVVLVDGDEVKTLGVDGEGSTRVNLKYVYLRSYLTPKRGRKSVCEKAGLTEEETEWLLSQPHPAMVEDTPAIVPNHYPGGQIKVDNSVDNDSELSNRYNAGNPHEAGKLSNYPIISDSKKVPQNDQIVALQNSCIFREILLKQVILYFKKEKMTKTNIIKVVFGAGSNAKAYKQIKDLYDYVLRSHYPEDDQNVEEEYTTETTEGEK